MPIKSYIALPHEGQEVALASAVRKITGCEIVLLKNSPVHIVVTDTLTDTDDEKLYEALSSIPSLKHITLVAGFNNI
jgi:hypothetical protein